MTFLAWRALLSCLFMALLGLPVAAADDGSTARAWASGLAEGAVKRSPATLALEAQVAHLDGGPAHDTIAAVASAPEEHFRPLSRPLSAGYTRQAHWLRITLRHGDTAPSRWLLEVSPGYLDDVRLYVPDASAPAGFREHASGDRLPFSAREVAHRFFVFPLALPKGGQPHTVYLRVQSTSTMLVRLGLYEPRTFAQATQGEYLGLGLQLGCLGLMLLYSLLHWRTLRKRYLRLFVCFVLSMLVAMLGLSGLAAQLLFPSHPALANLFAPMGACLFIFFGLWFFLDFLDAWRRHPWFGKLAGFTMAVSAVALPGIVLDYYVEIAPLMVACMLACMPCYLVVAWRSIGPDLPGSRWIVLAHTWYCLMISLHLLSLLGAALAPTWIHDWYYNHLVYLMFIMSAVVTRMREMEYLRDQAVASSIAAEMKAEAASAQREEKSRFLSLMAHELKTPLATLDAAVQALGYAAAPVDPASARRHQRIRDAVARLNTLLEDSLRVARNETGLHPMAKREGLDLQALEDALRADPAHAPVSMRFDAGPGDGCHADGMLVRRALGNLLDNALKYGAPGQPITLNVRRQAHDGRPGIAFEIASAWADGAQGGGKDRCEAWFGKHWRGPNSAGQPGLGLGLYLVRAIAEAHGGHAHCRPRPGSGDQAAWLVATLWLPVREDAHVNAHVIPRAGARVDVHPHLEGRTR